ncbi:uncharacterized protein LOC144159725 [Haemaphysalis longicornis]
MGPDGKTSKRRLLQATSAVDTGEKEELPLTAPSDINMTMAAFRDTFGIVLTVFKDEAALCVASSLHYPWGSQFLTKSGLLLNNFMAAFPKHELGPNKRPRPNAATVAVTNSDMSKLVAILGSAGVLGNSRISVVYGCTDVDKFPECVKTGKLTARLYSNTNAPLPWDAPPESDRQKLEELSAEDEDEELEAP